MEIYFKKQQRHEFFGFDWAFHYGDLSISDAEKTAMFSGQSHCHTTGLWITRLLSLIPKAVP